MAAAKRRRKKKKTTKRTHKRAPKRRAKGRKRSPGPTKFQRFLMRDPEAAKHKMGWK